MYFIIIRFFQAKTTILRLLFQAPDFKYIGTHNNCIIDTDNCTKIRVRVRTIHILLVTNKMLCVLWYFCSVSDVSMKPITAIELTRPNILVTDTVTLVCPYLPHVGRPTIETS